MKERSWFLMKMKRGYLSSQNFWDPSARIGPAVSLPSRITTYESPPGTLSQRNFARPGDLTAGERADRCPWGLTAMIEYSCSPDPSWLTTTGAVGTGTGVCRSSPPQS